MKTFFSLLAVAAAVNSALAQFQVNTPTNALQCVTTQISWVGAGSGPFFLTIRTPDANGQILQTYDNLASSPFQWSANISANIQLGLTLTDRSNGATALSGPFTLADSGDSSCLNGGAATPSAPGSSAPAPSAPASSGAATPSSPATPSAPATPSGTTPLPSTPTGSVTHTSSPSVSHSGSASSGSASPSGAGGSSSGALANTVSVGFVGAAGVLAAILI